MMIRAAGVGPWPERGEAASWASRSGGERRAESIEPGQQRPMVGTKISARLGALSVRLVATASATYARMGLGSVEARVLLILSSGPHSSSQVGKLIGVDRAAVCRAVQSLMERGLVVKLGGRERAVSLTGEGVDLIEGVNRLTAERERRLLAGFSDEEATALLGFLGRLMLNAPALTELAESRVFESLRD
jgi:DNA-binding MarR family transcriptional regulator